MGRIWCLNMVKKIHKNGVLCLALFSFLLCQCTTADHSPLPVVMNKKIATPYPKDSTAYLALAKKQEGELKQSALIKAAGRLISEGRWQQGLTILAQTRDLTDVQSDEKKILLAYIDSINSEFKGSVDKLSSVHQTDRMSLYHQIQYHELLAVAYHQSGRPADSLSERIKLEGLLPDESSQKNNRRSLWFTLTRLPLNELHTLLSTHTLGTEAEGWLRLAFISRQFRDNPQSLLTALNNWQTQFHHHPAHHLLPYSLDSVANKMINQPKQIALLLPLSGSLSGPGASVKEGFMSAYEAGPSGEEFTQIKVYDTAHGAIKKIYQQAIRDGADFVVGPLIKNQVAIIASEPHPVPTLLLNDTVATLEENTFLFGLSPSSEATQVALKARYKGYSKALVIAPKNEWGQEVIKVFSQQWQKKGGQVIDTLFYAAHDDLTQKIRDFLQINKSLAREKKMKQLLGQQLQTVPSRRQDFDVIFLLAYPTKARQIMPLLKYYYSGDVPVYATSSVYSGGANALKDKDLDGVIFCDIPWVFSHQMGVKNWPEQWNSYNRLYALGKDSYELVSRLNSLMLFPADGTKDNGAILYLKANQRIARVLEWGQFKQGLVHSLEGTV